MTNFTALTLRATAMQTPLLTEADERVLVQRFRQEGDLHAAETLVVSHLRLVYAIASQYTRLQIPQDDLVQEGAIGLMHAVKKFDPSHGARLAVYAAYWIKARIQDFILKNWRLVRGLTTKSRQRLFWTLSAWKKDSMSDEAIYAVANAKGVEKSDVDDMLQYVAGGEFSLSLDDAQPELDLPSGYPTPEQVLLEKEASHVPARLDQALRQLSERERRVVEVRWLSPQKKTLQEVGAEIGVSAERVRQIEGRALKTLRALLGDVGLLTAP